MGTFRAHFMLTEKVCGVIQLLGGGYPWGKFRLNRLCFYICIHTFWADYRGPELRYM